MTTLRTTPATSWQRRSFPPQQPAVREKQPIEAEPLMAWPFVVILFYFLTDFGRPQDWFPPFALIKPGMLALCGGTLGLLARRHQIFIPIRAKLIVAFLVLMALGTPLATNRYFAFLATRDFTYFLIGAVIPIMSFVNTYARLQRLVAFMLLIHVPLALYSITHKGVGIGSFLGDENDFCLALNVVLPYVFFSFYFARGTLRKLALIAVFATLLFAITATQSRGGFLGLIAAAGYCWVASPRKLVSLVTLAALTVPVLAIVPPSYWDEMKTIETSTENDDTGAQRLYLWNMGWQMFVDAPWGVGPTNYQWKSYLYESPDQQAKGLNTWGKGSHSLYFTLLPEHGVVGTGIFVAILVLSFRDNRRVRRAYDTLSKAGRLSPERIQQFYVLNVLTRANDASIVAYLVTGAFLSVLYYPHFWLQVALGVAIKRSADILMARECETSSAVQPAQRQGWLPRVSRA